ncbi:MAG TPA: aminotransferase class I/II-fold pyridoxal phosphate-dependent enzyme [Bacillota bacterium]|nr:aminotransferase class I/II-fold pyridoxal phosphate-dependent enzyme [Bacillota bacterium]
MELKPFALERWFGKYEFTARYNIAESCIKPFTVPELEEICGCDLLRTPEITNLGYTDSRGILELREEIAKLYPGRTTDNVLITTGAIEANYLVFMALLRPGDVVFTEFPAYQQLYEVPRALLSEVKLWELRSESNYRPDISKLDATMAASGTRMIVINHPHNPTGASLDAGSMAAICEIADQYGAVLLSDEVYRGLTLVDGIATPSAQLFSDNAITVGSMSKAFGLSGLRVGWIVGPEDIIEKCWTIRDYTSICPPGPSQAIALAALRNIGSIMARNTSLLRKNFSILNQWMSSNSDILSWIPPCEGAVAFVKYHVDADSVQVARELANADSVLVVPGACFDVEGHFRIGFGGDTDTLQAGLELTAKRLRAM